MNNEAEHPIRQIVGRGALVLLLLLTPFIPLILAFVENLINGTRHVENLCERLGIHDELAMLYEPIIKFIMGL